MEDEVLKGNRPTTTFTKSSWNHIEEQMKLYTGNVYTHQQTKNKFNGLRKTYKKFKKLVDYTSGAGWDPASGTITLADDVCKTFIKADKRVKVFKKKGCPYITNYALYMEIQLLQEDMHTHLHKFHQTQMMKLRKKIIQI